MVECLRSLKVEGFGFGIVVGLHVLSELLFQRPVFVQEDGVGDVECHLVIHFWQAVYQLLTVVIHGLNASFVEAQRLFQLLLCQARSRIVHHSQDVGDAQR